VVWFGYSAQFPLVLRFKFMYLLNFCHFLSLSKIAAILHGLSFLVFIFFNCVFCKSHRDLLPFLWLRSPYFRSFDWDLLTSVPLTEVSLLPFLWLRSPYFRSFTEISLLPFLWLRSPYFRSFDWGLLTSVLLTETLQSLLQLHGSTALPSPIFYPLPLFSV
jgi:hypothetical protein